MKTIFKNIELIGFGILMTVLITYVVYNILEHGIHNL